MTIVDTFKIICRPTNINVFEKSGTIGKNLVNFVSKLYCGMVIELSFVQQSCNRKRQKISKKQNLGVSQNVENSLA